MSTPAQRAAFEEAYAKRFPFSSSRGDKFKRDELGDYEDGRVFAAWEMWQAALSRPQVADGWRPVPVEPTAAMVDAGVKHECFSSYMTVRKIYHAMIAASPVDTQGDDRDSQ